MNAFVSPQAINNNFFIGAGKTGTRFTLRRSVFDEKKGVVTTQHVRNLGTSLEDALATAEKYMIDNFPNGTLCKDVGHLEVKPRRSTASKEDQKHAYMQAVIALGVLTGGKYSGRNVSELPESYLRWSWENRTYKTPVMTHADADVCMMFNFIKEKGLDKVFQNA